MIPIEKWYGVCISPERRKNLEKYEHELGIHIDTTFTENAFLKNEQYYKESGLITKDWQAGALGAMGCAVSFGNIFKDVVKNNYQYAVIFEDDIDWNEEFYGAFTKEKFYEELARIDYKSEDWDIFYLGTESKGGIERQRHIVDNVYELETSAFTVPLEAKTWKAYHKSTRSAPVRTRNFGGNHAFIITNKGAREVLKYCDPAIAVADGLVGYAINNGDMRGNRCFIPTLFTQISHPRGVSFLRNKLWSSLTGASQWSGDQVQKYSDDMTKVKKGCAAYPISEKYPEEFERPQYKEIRTNKVEE